MRPARTPRQISGQGDGELTRGRAVKKRTRAPDLGPSAIRFDGKGSSSAPAVLPKPPAAIKRKHEMKLTKVTKGWQATCDCGWRGAIFPKGKAALQNAVELHPAGRGGE